MQVPNILKNTAVFIVLCLIALSLLVLTLTSNQESNSAYALGSMAGVFVRTYLIWYLACYLVSKLLPVFSKKFAVYDIGTSKNMLMLVVIATASSYLYTTTIEKHKIQQAAVQQVQTLQAGPHSDSSKTSDETTAAIQDKINHAYLTVDSMNKAELQNLEAKNIALGKQFENDFKPHNLITASGLANAERTLKEYQQYVTQSTNLHIKLYNDSHQQLSDANIQESHILSQANAHKVGAIAKLKQLQQIDEELISIYSSLIDLIKNHQGHVHVTEENIFEFDNGIAEELYLKLMVQLDALEKKEKNIMAYFERGEGLLKK